MTTSNDMSGLLNDKGMPAELCEEQRNLPKKKLYEKPELQDLGLLRLVTKFSF